MDIALLVVCSGTGTDQHSGDLVTWHQETRIGTGTGTGHLPELDSWYTKVRQMPIVLWYIQVFRWGVD